MNFNLETFIINFIIALSIFLIGRYISKYLTKLAIQTVRKSGVDSTLTGFLESALYGLLLLLIILAALSQLGVKTTSFIAIIGALGLAIGLAFQGTLSNISAGIMIIIFRPINKGEFVEAGGATGTVEEINIFNTILKTGDNKIIIISNSKIISNNITNYSKKDTRRVDITFGIGYNDDLKLAKEILQDILNTDDRILHEPAKPFVAVSELGDSSVNFITRSWVKSENYWSVYFDIVENVKLTFDEKGISIPYPQMDVHVHKIKK